MSAIGRRVTVSNTPKLIAEPGEVVILRNRDASNDVELGGPAVAAGAGFLLSHLNTLDTTVDCGADALYAIRSGSVDVVIHVLITRSDR